MLLRPAPDSNPKMGNRIEKSYTTPAKAVKPPRPAGYTIRHGGVELYVRASHHVLLALLRAVLNLKRRVSA